MISCVVQVVRRSSSCLYSSVGRADVVSDTARHVGSDKNGQKDVAGPENSRRWVAFFLSMEFGCGSTLQSDSGRGAWLKVWRLEKRSGCTEPWDPFVTRKRKRLYKITATIYYLVPTICIRSLVLVTASPPCLSIFFLCVSWAGAPEVSFF